MRLLSAQERDALHLGRPAPGTVVFRQSRLLGVIGAAVFIAITAGLAWLLVAGILPKFFWISVVVLGLIIPALITNTAALFRASNWVMAVSDRGVWLNIRSYSNHHLDPDAPVAAEILWRDITAARLRREDPMPARRQGERRSRVEIGLELIFRTLDTDTLAEAIEDEARRPAPKRHIAPGVTVSGRSPHRPVSVPEPGLVRIGLRGAMDCVLPGPTRAIAILGGRIPIEPELRIHREDPASMSEQTFGEFVRELAERGDPFTAADAIRRRYGSSPTQTATTAKSLRDEAA